MKFSILRAFFLCLVGLWGAASAAAHGGGEIQFANAPIGPYKMTLWLNPPAPQAQQTMHITIGLSAPPNDAPMLDATILIEISDAASGSLILTTPATTEASINKLFYETDFTLAEPGAYQVNARVSAPDGEGSAAFTMEVNPASRTNWLLVGLLGLGFIFLYTLLHGRRRYEA